MSQLPCITNNYSGLKLNYNLLTLPEEEYFDLPELLKEINQLFAKETKKKDFQFKIKIAQCVPQYIHLDRTKLRQVLIYLIENSFNFTLKGEITLSVEASLIAENSLSKPEGGPPKYQLFFRITDTGLGLEGVHDKLVERFKMNPDIAMNYALQEENGLGLSISHYWVNKMKGSISIVHTERDKGSTFQFEVPANEAIAFKLTQSHHNMLIMADKNQNRQPLLELLILLGFDSSELKEASNEVDKKLIFIIKGHLFILKREKNRWGK